MLADFCTCDTNDRAARQMQACLGLSRLLARHGARVLPPLAARLRAPRHSDKRLQAAQRCAKITIVAALSTWLRSQARGSVELRQGGDNAICDLIDATARCAVYETPSAADPALALLRVMNRVCARTSNDPIPVETLLRQRFAGSNPKRLNAVWSAISAAAPDAGAAAVVDLTEDAEEAPQGALDAALVDQVADAAAAANTARGPERTTSTTNAGSGKAAPPREAASSHAPGPIAMDAAERGSTARSDAENREPPLPLAMASAAAGPGDKRPVAAAPFNDNTDATVAAPQVAPRNSADALADTASSLRLPRGPLAAATEGDVAADVADSPKADAAAVADVQPGSIVPAKGVPSVADAGQASDAASNPPPTAVLTGTVAAETPVQDEPRKSVVDATVHAMLDIAQHAVCLLAGELPKGTWHFATATAHSLCAAIAAGCKHNVPVTLPDGTPGIATVKLVLQRDGIDAEAHLRPLARNAVVAQWAGVQHIMGAVTCGVCPYKVLVRKPGQALSAAPALFTDWMHAPDRHMMTAKPHSWLAFAAAPASVAGMYCGPMVRFLNINNCKALQTPLMYIKPFRSGHKPPPLDLGAFALKMLHTCVAIDTYLDAGYIHASVDLDHVHATEYTSSTELGLAYHPALDVTKEELAAMTDGERAKWRKRMAALEASLAQVVVDGGGSGADAGTALSDEERLAAAEEMTGAPKDVTRRTCCTGHKTIVFRLAAGGALVPIAASSDAPAGAAETGAWAWLRPGDPDGTTGDRKMAGVVQQRGGVRMAFKTTGLCAYAAAKLTFNGIMEAYLAQPRKKMLTEKERRVWAQSERSTLLRESGAGRRLEDLLWSAGLLTGERAEGERPPPAAPLPELCQKARALLKELARGA